MNQDKKRGIAFVILAGLILMGLLFYSSSEKKEEGKEKMQASVLQTRSPGSTETILPQKEGLETDPLARAADKETTVPEQEEMSADLDISSIPDEIIDALDMTKKELEERIKMFANGKGFAAEKIVYYHGEYTINDSEGTLVVPLYFQPEGISDTFDFNLVYYRESENLVIEQW